MLTTGEHRLQKIHKRVEYLLQNYHPEHLKRPCLDCTDKILEATKGPSTLVNEESKRIFNRCTELTWCCKSRNRLIEVAPIKLKDDELVGEEKYKEAVEDLMVRYKQKAPQVIYSLDHHHKRLHILQPHLRDITFSAEFYIFLNYKPFSLKNNIFPVAELGKDFRTIYTPPEVSEDDDIGFEKCILKEASSEKYPEKRTESTAASWGGNHDPKIQAILPHILQNTLADGLPNKVDKVKQQKPCNHCIDQKEKHAWKNMRCTSFEPLCQFKFDYLHDWPEEIQGKTNCTTTLLNCNNLPSYAKLMNYIFNLKYIERCMAIKNYLDREICNIYNEMYTIANLYDLCLYRYYKNRDIDQVCRGESDEEIFF
jgi:hypothetical protein